MSEVQVGFSTKILTIGRFSGLAENSALELDRRSSSERERSSRSLYISTSLFTIHQFVFWFFWIFFPFFSFFWFFSQFFVVLLSKKLFLFLFRGVPNFQKMQLIGENLVVDSVLRPNPIGFSSKKKVSLFWHRVRTVFGRKMTKKC